MVKIRLQRVGATKKPAYRVVVADSRSPRDGAFIEVIGHYDPLTNPATIVIQQEKALEWLRRGAMPTQTVASLLGRAGLSDKLVSASLRKTTDRKTLKKSEKKAAANKPKRPQSRRASQPQRKPRQPQRRRANQRQHLRPKPLKHRRPSQQHSLENVESRN